MRAISCSDGFFAKRVSRLSRQQTEELLQVFTGYAQSLKESSRKCRNSGIRRHLSLLAEKEMDVVLEIEKYLCG